MRASPPFYYVVIKEYEMTEKSEEFEISGETTEMLFQRLEKTGDPFLRHTIIVRNLHLVRPVVKKHAHLGGMLEDLVQVGYIGLIKAVDLFDVHRKVKFSTFATRWIEGEIMHYVRDKADIARKPRWLSELSGRVNRFMDDYVQSHQKFPEVSEIAQALNIDEEGIREIIKSRGVLSISQDGAEFPDEVDINKIRSMKPETFRLPIEDRIMIEQAVDRLKQLEKRIVFLFFYYDFTQMQIAEKLGLSQRKVSRILGKAVFSLKQFFQGKSVLFIFSIMH
jgi:RNA polymerase sigma-B factor